MCGFYLILILNYDALESKSPFILLNKNTNFNKNETESRIHFHNIHTSTYQKTLLHTVHFFACFKIVESLQCCSSLTIW